MSSSITATHEIKYLDEITNFFAIDFESVLTTDTYSHPLRSYHLIKSEARCQFLKKGKRCGQEHSHGYAVESKDGQQMLIGNCCAFNHLSLDDDLIKHTLQKFSSNEKLSIRRYRISVMLEQRTELLSRVKNTLKKLRSLQSEALRIREAFPSAVIDNLVERWRRSSHQVIWEYLITKRDKNADTRDAKEDRWYPHTYGFLKGLGLWLDLDSQKFDERLYAFLHRVEAIPTKQPRSKVELDEAEAALQELRTISVIEREIDNQRRLLADFLGPDNLILTVQLIKTQTLRAECVEAVQKLTSTSFNMRPDRFVAGIDQELKRLYGATGIRIAS